MSNPSPRPTLAQIKAAAEGAEVIDDGWFVCESYPSQVLCHEDGQGVIICDAKPNDARHIATCDPATVLWLVGWVERAKQKLEDEGHHPFCAMNEDEGIECDCDHDALLSEVTDDGS